MLPRRWRETLLSSAIRIFMAGSRGGLIPPPLYHIGKEDDQTRINSKVRDEANRGHDTWNMIPEKGGGELIRCSFSCKLRGNPRGGERKGKGMVW